MSDIVTEFIESATPSETRSHARGYYRYQRRAHIARKKGIIKRTHSYWVTIDGALNKGKIHCSCPMCRRKSYDEKTLSDLRKDDRDAFSLKEYFEVAG